MNSGDCSIVRRSSGKLSPESGFLLSKHSGEGHVARLARGSQTRSWDVGVCMSPCSTGRAGVGGWGGGRDGGRVGGSSPRGCRLPEAVPKAVVCSRCNEKPLEGLMQGKYMI